MEVFGIHVNITVVLVTMYWVCQFPCGTDWVTTRIMPDSHSLEPSRSLSSLGRWRLFVVSSRISHTAVSMVSSSIHILFSLVLTAVVDYSHLCEATYRPKLEVIEEQPVLYTPTNDDLLAMYRAWGLTENGVVMKSRQSSITLMRGSSEEHPIIWEMSCPPRIVKPTGGLATDLKRAASVRASYFFPFGVRIIDILDPQLQKRLYNVSIELGETSGWNAAKELCRVMHKRVETMITRRDTKILTETPPFFEIHNEFPIGSDTPLHYTFTSRAVPDDLINVGGIRLDINALEFQLAIPDGKMHLRVHSKRSRGEVPFYLDFVVEKKRNNLVVGESLCPNKVLRKRNKKRGSSLFAIPIRLFPSKWPQFHSINHTAQASVTLPSGAGLKDVEAAIKWLTVGAAREVNEALSSSSPMSKEDIEYLTTFGSPAEFLIRRYCLTSVTPNVTSPSAAAAAEGGKEPSLGRFGSLKRKLKKLGFRKQRK